MFVFLAALNRDGDATRARIMQVIRNFPGSHTASISERTGLAWSTVDYHLRVLGRSDVIKVVKALRERHAFPTSVEPRQHMWFTALRDEGTNRIFQRLIEIPRQGVPMLSDWAGLSQKVIRRQLTDLEDVGLVKRHGISRPTFEPDFEAVRQLPPTLLDQGAPRQLQIELA